MFTHSTLIRVGYADTDQMGVVHHSKYVLYCETARSEAIRDLGITYKDVEENGIFMPVATMKFDFMKPALYDEMLTVKTILREIPRSRMIFENELYNSNGILLSTAEVSLAFINKETRKPCLPPQFLLQTLQPYFV